MQDVVYCYNCLAQGDLYINKPIIRRGLIVFAYSLCMVGWLVGPRLFLRTASAKLRILTILYIFVVVHENLGNNMLDESYLVHG